jgi:hypothetical protein
MFTANFVSEPLSWGMLSLGALGLLGMLQRKRRS